MGEVHGKLLGTYNVYKYTIYTYTVYFSIIMNYMEIFTIPIHKVTDM